jgi:hypothetical protein
VAVKVSTPAEITEEVIDIFVKEGLLSSQFQHKNVVRFHGLCVRYDISLHNITPYERQVIVVWCLQASSNSDGDGVVLEGRLEILPAEGARAVDAGEATGGVSAGQ